MAVFIKISESFVLSNGKNEDLAPEYKEPIVGRFKKIKPDTICLNMDPSGDRRYVSFECGQQNKVSGDLSMEVNGKNIEIKCDAIFKIDIKPEHKENFLSGKGTWTFSSIQQGESAVDYILGDVTKGLKLKKYKIKNMFGTFDRVDAIMSNVQTGSKKTDFK